MTSFGQAARHLPQPAHLSWSIRAFLFSITGAPCAQIRRQLSQPIHPSGSATYGFPSLCISIFPALEPHPMPIFFRAPPNPAISCPLKCVSVSRISASITAEPIFASFTYSPFTGTSVSSVPFSPSPIITWHPVAYGVNPFRYAVSIWSSAFFRLPTYNVLQSVKNGFPPHSFTRSAITFA